MDHRQAIRTFVGELLTAKGDTRSTADGDALIVSGRLASMDVLNLVGFLEERYGVDFSDGFDQNDLDSVDSIVALVRERGGT